MLSGSSASPRAAGSQPWVLPERFKLVGVCFLAAAACYLDRVGFPLAYTAAAARAGVDKATQGRVHSAFYHGYTLSQIPGGWAASRFGGERVLSASFLLWSTVSLLTPSDGGATGALSAARTLLGGAMGVVFPAIHSILAAWIPPHERSRAVSFFTSGMYFGSAAGCLLLPSLIAARGPASVPRCVGLVGLAWLLLWRGFALRRPGGGAAGSAMGTSALLPGAPPNRKPDVPWGALLRCVPLWALVANNFTFHYAFFILMSWLPTLYDSLGADATRLGALKMLPYLVMGVASNAGGFAADALIVRGFGVTRTRKLINSVGFALASIALLLLPTARRLDGAIFLACCAMGSLALARGGYSVNHMDIAPRHAGVLMGISNGAGSAAGMVGPWVTGRILARAAAGAAGSRAAWRAACAVPAGLCTLGAAVYLAFGTGERLFD